MEIGVRPYMFGRRPNPHSHRDGYGFPRCLNRPLSEACVDRAKAWRKRDDGATAGNSSSALLGNIILDLRIDRGLLPMNLRVPWFICDVIE